MKTKWMWLLGVATAVVVGSSLMIPAAVGATPNARAASQGTCTAKGSKPLGNTGVISVSTKGTSPAGTPAEACTAKVTGKWAKNSREFTVDVSAPTKLEAGGHWSVPVATMGPLTNAKIAGTLTGAGAPPVGTAMTISINCVISYPPLKIVCTIKIDWGSSAAPRQALQRPAVVTAPLSSTAAALCTANGAKPLGNTGVVSLSAAGKGQGTTGTPTACTAKVVGKWKKNSTQFSFDATGKATVGKGGVWKLLPGTSLAPLTGTVGGTLTGGGVSTGTAITVEIRCWLSYPPLKAGCQIIISS